MKAIEDYLGIGLPRRQQTADPLAVAAPPSEPEQQYPSPPPTASLLYQAANPQQPQTHLDEIEGTFEVTSALRSRVKDEPSAEPKAGKALPPAPALPQHALPTAILT